MQFKGTHKIIYPFNAVISLIGPNGAGKSTFFDMQTYPGFSKAEGKTKEEIPNETMEKGERCFVQHKFMYKNELYLVRRDTERANDTFLKRANGELIAKGPSPTSKEFKKMFGVDFKTFCSAFIARQDELRTLLTGETADRKKLITDLTSLNVSDISSKKAKELANMLEKSIVDLQKYLVDVEEWQSKKDGYEKELNSLLQQMSQTERQLEQEKALLIEKQNLLEQEESRYRTYQALLRSVGVLQNKIQMLEGQIQEINSRLQHLELLKSRLEELSGCKEKLDGLLEKQQTLTLLETQYKQKQYWETQYQERADFYTKQKNLYEQEKATFDNMEIPATRIPELEQKQQELQAALQEAHGKQQEIQGEGKGVAFLIQTETQTLQALRQRGADAPCPTCAQPLGKETYESEVSKHEQTLQEYIEQKEELLKQYRTQGGLMQELQTKLQEEQKTLTSFREQERVYEQKKSNVARLYERAADAHKRALEAYQQCEQYKDASFNEEEMKQVKAELSVTNENYEEWMNLNAKLAEIPNLQNSLSQLTLQLTETCQQHETEQTSSTKLGFQEEFYTALVNDVRARQQRTTDLTNESLRWQNQAHSIQKEIKLAQDTLNQHYATLEKISSVQNDIVMYRVMSSSFGASKEALLKKLEPALSQSMSRNIRNITKGRYDLVKLDDTYYPYMYRNGVLKPWSKFSGGEKDLLALLLRLAISDALIAKAGSGFQSLFLDEVFSSLDDERKSDTMNLLRSLRGKFSQVYIVTHTESIKDMTDCTLRVSFDGKTSRIEWQAIPPHIEKEFEKTRELLKQFAS